MKKLLSLILLLLFMSLSSCAMFLAAPRKSENKPSSDEAQTTLVESSESSVVSTVLSTDVADDAKTTEESTEATTTESSESSEPDGSNQDHSSASFEELTVVDNEHAVITLTGIDPDDMWGYTIHALLENKSTDVTFMYSVMSASINDVETDPLFAVEVAPGKKSNEEISFSKSTLEAYGITDFTDIEMSFRVYDTNDWQADDVAEETVNIYPLGKDKAKPFVREALDTDTVLVDHESLKLSVIDYEMDEIWGYTVNMVIENTSDTVWMASADDVSVNGFMIEPFWASEVQPGKTRFTSMSFSEKDLKENKIEKVEAIEFKLRVYDSEHILEEDLFNEVVTLKP